jgi:AbrB family looped-hinge helix DNA binding protein
VDVAARVTSKGQVTVPKAVREALGISEGDDVIFRVEGNRAPASATSPRSTGPSIGSPQSSGSRRHASEADCGAET